MEQYFFKIDASYSHKNKLYEALSAHVHNLNHLLIRDQETRQAFEKALHLKCEELNQKFSRCKPIRIIASFGGGGLLVPGSWSASFYPVQSSVELKDAFLQYHI